LTNANSLHDVSARSIGLTDPFLKNTPRKVRKAPVVLDFGQTFLEEPLFGFKSHNDFLFLKKKAT